MAKRKNPATAGEKIVAGVRFCKPLIDGLTFDDRDDLIRYIDRAIARAVRKERERCMGLIANARDATPYTALSKVTISRVLCSIEEGEQP